MRKSRFRGLSDSRSTTGLQPVGTGATPVVSTIMKYLVTGGAGFIGSHLVDALIARGDTVRVLDNLVNSKEENVSDLAQLIVADVCNRDMVEEAVDGVDAVFHLASLGSVQRSMRDPVVVQLANVNGTLTVLEACRQADIKKFVFSSSSSVYGGLMDESGDCQYEAAPPYPRSPYAGSKLQGEVLCTVYSRAFQLDTTCLRYFNVFGPRQRFDSDYAAVIPLFMRAAITDKKIKIFGDGEQSRDFTYVSNVVDANLLALNQTGHNVYNVGCERTWNINELASAIEQVSGVAFEREHLPTRPGDVARSCASGGVSRAWLKYEPKVDLVSGLKKTWEWCANLPT